MTYIRYTLIVVCAFIISHYGLGLLDNREPTVWPLPWLFVP